MSLARWLIVLLVAVVMCLLLAVAASYVVSWRKLHQVEQEQLMDYAKAVARQISARSQDLQALVESLARDPQWQELDPASFAQQEQRLAQMIPRALWVRLLPPDLEDAATQLGFADLDLVQRAMEQNPPLAMHGAGSKRHVAVARAIDRGDRVVAILLVAVDPKWLYQGLPTPRSGAFAVTQGNLTLAYRGEDGLKTAEPAGTLPIRGTLWQVRYRTPPSEFEGMHWVMVAWLLPVLLISALFYGFWRWWKQAMAKDNATILNLVNDLLNGAIASNYVPVVQELQPLIDRLLIVFQSRQQASVKPLPQVVAPEEVEVTAAVSEPPAAEAAPVLQPRPTAVTVPEAIFHPCHIRAAQAELTPDICHELGRAIGSEVQAQGERMISVGRDLRQGSDERAKALIEGLKASGCDVVDLGAVPTPMVYFACHYLTSRSGVMVTGGSCPADYHGLKIVIAGEFYSGDKLQSLQQRLQAEDLKTGMGSSEQRDLLADYIGAVIDDVQFGRPMKVIVDSGAGVAGSVASAMLRTLGCEVVELRSESMLDPGTENALTHLRAQVKEDEEAELGLAFDGDGDRLVVVDARGNWVPADQVLMLLATDVLSREPGGDVAFDLECGRHLAHHIVQNGGRPVVAPVGFCQLQAKAAETGAVLAGGFSGHMIFRERWFGIDDAIYGAARLLEILSAEPLTSEEVFAELPQSVSTPYLDVDLDSKEITNAMRILQATADKFFDGAKVDTTSGVRIDFANGWGIVRPAGCRPALRLRFEADDRAAMEQIRSRFQEWFETCELPVTSPLAMEASDG